MNCRYPRVKISDQAAQHKHMHSPVRGNLSSLMQYDALLMVCLKPRTVTDPVISSLSLSRFVIILASDDWFTDGRFLR